MMSLMNTEDTSYDNNLKKLGYADPAKPGGIGCWVKPVYLGRGNRLSPFSNTVRLLLPRQIDDGNHHSQQSANRDDSLGVHGTHLLPEMPPGRMRRRTDSIVARKCCEMKGALLPRHQSIGFSVK